MHVSYWLMIVGVVGYAGNALVIYHYVKGLQTQIRDEVRQEKRYRRRHPEESQDEKWSAHERVIKENPAYKWTMHIGTVMFLSFAVGLVWMVLRLVRLLP